MRMSRRTAFGGVCALCFFSALSYSQDSIQADSYLSFLPGYVFPERAIGPARRGLSAAALFGKPLSPHFSVELNGAGAILETGNDGGTDFYQQTLSADLVLNFLGAGERTLRPFALLGVGAVYDDFFPDERDGTGLLLEGGLGLATRPLFWDRVALRAEARYLHDGREGGHGETRVSLGIEIPLGRSAQPVKYVTVEKVVEKEVVREVERRWTDSDRDNVEDSRDRCPDTPQGLKVDADGCVIVNQAIALQGVTFEFAKARLTPNAQTVLDGVSRAFVGQAGLRVEIAGHTDTIGTDAANLRLSQQRADAVRAYLISKGAKEPQLSAQGYGESQLLVAPERSDDDREQNRRVELRVIDGR